MNQDTRRTLIRNGIIIGVLLVLFVLFRSTVDFYTDWLWFASLGKQQVLQTRLMAQTSLWLASGLLITLLLVVGISRYLIMVIGALILASSIGIELSFADMGWMQSVVMLFALIPFTVAGGLGVREVGLVFMLSAFGVEPEAALAFSLLLFARQIVLGLTGGILEAFRTLRVQRSQ